MIAVKKFEGVIGGKLVTFQKGDAITKDQAEEMGLQTKPGLAKKETKKNGS
jgi:hypothetical protein